jgi:hypothetical protein
MGLVSVATIPHPLVHPSRFHGISLRISSLITGLVRFSAGRFEGKLGRKPAKFETFWIGYNFALAFGAARFALV